MLKANLRCFIDILILLIFVLQLGCPSGFSLGTFPFCKRFAAKRPAQHAQVVLFFQGRISYRHWVAFVSHAVAKLTTRAQWSVSDYIHAWMYEMTFCCIVVVYNQNQPLVDDGWTRILTPKNTGWSFVIVVKPFFFYMCHSLWHCIGSSFHCYQTCLCHGWPLFFVWRNVFFLQKIVGDVKTVFERISWITVSSFTTSNVSSWRQMFNFFLMVNNQKQPENYVSPQYFLQWWITRGNTRIHFNLIIQHKSYESINSSTS